MKLPLSKLFFYLFIILLPISTSRAYFTETSFYGNYHAFYNTIFIYLTDLIICGLIVTWAWEIHNSPAPPLKLRGGWGALFHRLTTDISQSWFYKSLVAFWLILAVSVLVSRETLISAYGLLKFTEFFLLLAYIKQNINVSREIEVIFSLIVAISTLEALVGISQYFTQSSLGLGIFGESVLVPGMKGIAEFMTSGLANPLVGEWFRSFQSISPETINIRAYGTLPHPNVLGVFLFTGLLANLWLIYNAKSRSEPAVSTTGVSRKHNPLSPPYVKGEAERVQSPPLKVRGGWEGLLNVSREILLAVSLIVISTGLVLTFSRTVWLVTALALVALFVSLKLLKRKVFASMQAGQRQTGAEFYRPKRIALILLVLLASLAMNMFLFGQQIKDRLDISPSPGVEREGERSNDESIINRQLYNSYALKMFRDHPVTGVGLRNFIVRMDEYSLSADEAGGERLVPHLHQPAHNIYLLLLAETGVLGLAAFLFLIFNIVRRAKHVESHAERGDSGGVRLILMTMFGGFLLLGFFDHYFFSLHHGGLMFWLAAGLLTAKPQQE